MQLFFWALQSLKPFAKRTSDNSSFYANESINGSLCSLPLGKPSPPSPLTSQSAPPEGSLHWTPSVKTLHCRGVCWHWSKHWDYLFLQIWSQCPGIRMGRWEDKKVSMASGCLWPSSNSLQRKGQPGRMCYIVMNMASKSPVVAITSVIKIHFSPLQHGQMLYFLSFLGPFKRNSGDKNADLLNNTRF